MNDKEESMRIGRRIAEIRENVEWTDENGIRRTKMTQTDLSKITGIYRTHLVRIEQGKYDSRLSVIAHIADALGYKLDLVPKE